MKLTSYTLLAVAAACGFASAQTTAFTTPVGYVSLGDTTIGQPAVKANTDVAVSIPLNRPTEYAGATTTAGTITVAGTPWVASPGVGSWAESAATPYLVAVTSGTENGFVGLISSNTTNTLSVTPVTGGSVANLLVGDKFKIYKAWTLITLFPAASVPTGTRVLAFTGTTSGINLAPDLAYVWTGTLWQQITGLPGGAQNNAILYSGESFIVRAAATQVATLTCTGEVPVQKSRTDIAKLTVGVAQDNRISYFSPVNEIIGQSGLSATPGINVGDRLLAFNNNAAGINKAPTEALVWTGTIWQGVTGVGGDQTNIYTIKGGQGYVYRRLNTAAVGTLDWKDQQTYMPLP